jgi:2-polyprenyl-3-methyl-5-hydroxy-6-metoxy-1,4-benzoquinol methylase
MILKGKKLVIKNIYRFSTLNNKEMSQFDKIENWWHPSGPMHILYQYNYHRVKFLKKNVTEIKNMQKPFEDLHMLDVGCGAGFLT